MKTSVKIAVVLVLALLANAKVKAQQIGNGGLLSAAGGSSLSLDLSSANISFTQNEGEQAVDQTTTVTISSTHSWTFSVYTDTNNMVETDNMSHTFPVSKVSLSGFVNGTLENGKEVSVTGTGNSSNNSITWTLNDPGNVYAGTYQASVYFKLIKN